MELLPCELIDLMCQWLTLKDMSTLLSVNKFFHQLISENHFYSFCRDSFDCDHEKNICNLMKNHNYFQRFYLCHPEKHNHNYIFRVACIDGYLQSAVWLKETYAEINIHGSDEWFFVTVCRNGHLEVAKYLQQIWPEVYIREMYDDAFRISCAWGQLETAKWLREIYPKINIRSREDYAFAWACENGYMETAEYLTQICPSYAIVPVTSEHYKSAEYISRHLGEVLFTIKIDE